MMHADQDVPRTRASSGRAHAGERPAERGDAHMHELSGVASPRATHAVQYLGMPSAWNEPRTSAGCRSRCGAKPACPSAGATSHASMSNDISLPETAPISEAKWCAMAHASSNMRIIVAGQPASTIRRMPSRTAGSDTADGSQPPSGGVV